MCGAVVRQTLLMEAHLTAENVPNNLTVISMSSTTIISGGRFIPGLREHFPLAADFQIAAGVGGKKREHVGQIVSAG